MRSSACRAILDHADVSGPTADFGFLAEGGYVFGSFPIILAEAINLNHRNRHADTLNLHACWVSECLRAVPIQAQRDAFAQFHFRRGQYGMTLEPRILLFHLPVVQGILKS